MQEEGQERVYPFEHLQDPIGTQAHLFIPRWSDDEDVIIMPLCAFEDRTHMEVFGHMVHEWINKSDEDEVADDEADKEPPSSPPPTPR